MSSEKKRSVPHPEEGHEDGGLLFRLIAKQPWLFCILLPAIFIVLTAVGFTRDNYVEDSVGNIWIPRSDKIVKNEEYMDSIGKADWGASSFAAMALSRDGENIFTESRLNEIKNRMDAIEALTVEHNNQTFTWEDVCASNSLGAGTGTTYRFPCARLSPMDLFQETRSYFDTVDRLTWYHGVVKGAAIRPRVLRFGAMSQFCLPSEEAPTQMACAHQAGLRTNPDYAEANGYPREYANPLGLIGDVGSLEMNNPCRICIEEELEAGLDQLQQMIIPFFKVLSMEFQRYLATLEDPDERATVRDLAEKTGKLAETIDSKAVEDFYYYNVIRNTYAKLGSEGYQNLYNNVLMPSLPVDCEKFPCPPMNISLEEAEQSLKEHADAAFSSVSTAGSPLPLWDESDGTGSMLAGTNPVGGSGIDMSGDIRSGAYYLDLQNYGNMEAWSPVYNITGFAKPSDPMFQALVGANPVYAWFMAGETEMTASCGNENLPGANTNDHTIDEVTAGLAAKLSQKWCTPFNVLPDGATAQGYARMWYDLLLDSDAFLGLTQGEDDPYTFTLGAGCGYTLGGERYPYTGKTEAEILGNASRELYFIDEGASVGVLDRHLLIGDATPTVDNYSYENPLQKVGVIQSLFAAHGTTEGIVQRVKNCNRPGGPVEITEDDARDILKKMKEEFDDVWSKGFGDKNYGEVQFVSFSDDVGGAPGTSGRFLHEITLANGKLTAISIIIIAAFSVFLMFSLDPVESKVLVTLVGVALVLLSYFSALGFSIILGIKLNVATAWTLPFILLGLGCDDMYIVLMALKKESGYTENHFVHAMKEVVVPVTMTSLVNACMFAVMNISDVPAVYLTARVALIAVCFLYLSIIFCFSAFCLLDMRRQQAGKKDVCFCSKAEERDVANKRMNIGTWISELLYDRFFRPMLIDVAPMEKVFTHGVLWIVGGLLLGLAIWGITEREVGLGLEDFFPEDHQAYTWASKRTESLASWSIGIHWGNLDYGNPNIQLKMIKQFEDVVSHPNVAAVDTEQLWIAKLNIWTTRQCEANVARPHPDTLRCGRDQVWPVDNSTCSGTWMKNDDYGLRSKYFDDGTGTCQPFKGGICRPTSQMHPADLADLGVNPSEEEGTLWCPVFEDWSDEKMAFCIKQWRFLTGGGGGLILEDEHGTPTECQGEYYNNEEVRVPIPYSTGPTMFTYDLFTHEITTDVIEETRKFCDYSEELHCWLTGIPYNYWSQYVGIFDLLLEISGASIAVGFGVAVIFLLLQLSSEQKGQHKLGRVIGGSLVGALLITVVVVLSLVCVVGLSILAGVSVTGFSNMSFVLSVGFSVEYSVHIVSRWLHAPSSLSGPDRVHYAMSFLLLPTFMSFVSSTIGVVCLAFTEFSFTEVFYFRPLIIVMFVTYFIGCWLLPAFLTLFDFDFLKLGVGNDDVSPEVEDDKEEPEGTQTQTVGLGQTDLREISDHSC